MPASSFDYEAKRWGAGGLRPKPWFMNGLKLRYLLEDLVSVRGRALDVGCGAGQVAKAVKRERPDLDVLASDVSRAAIAAASTSTEGVHFRLATAERLPFADGELDFVWIFDVLEHVDDPEVVLREVARVLKPGGGFHIVLPLEGQPRTLYRLVRTGTRWTAKVRHGGHIQVFSAERFQNEVELPRSPAGPRPPLLHMARHARAGQRLGGGHVSGQGRDHRRLDARGQQGGRHDRVG